MATINDKTRRQMPIGVSLLLIYLLTVAVRFFLAIKTHKYPTTLIDEPLYISLARSIGTGNGLLFMGQPADFSNILYPLLLSPVYAIFPEGTNYFQVLQLWSICLMNLAIFPVYFLFESLLTLRKRALELSILTLLMPDFLLGGMLLGEAVIFPLAMALLYCAYRYFQGGDLKHMLLIALFGCLLYAAKPGHIALPIAFFLVALVTAFKSSASHYKSRAIMGVAAFIVLLFAYHSILSSVFGYNSGLLGLYEEQVFFDGNLQLGEFFKNVLRYPYFFFIACGGITVMGPVLYFNHYSSSQRNFLTCIALALAFTIVGTAWMVNRIEIAQQTIHMRYIAMYIPVLLAYLLLVPDHTSTKLKSNTEVPSVFLLVIAFFVTGCSILWGCEPGNAAGKVITSTASLAILRDISIPQNMLFPASIIIALLAIVLAILLPKMKPISVYKLSAATMLILAFANNFLFCAELNHNIYPGLDEETQAIHDLIGDKDYMIVYSTTKTVNHTLLQANTKKDVYAVSVNNLYNSMLNQNGNYVPFVPDHRRGTISVNTTPDVELLVLDEAAFNHLLLTEDAHVLNPDGKFLYVVSIPKDKPWVKSMMGGPISHVLDAGTNCLFRIFDPEMQSNPVSLHLEMELAEESVVIIDDGITPVSFTLPAGRDTYNASFPEKASLLAVTIPEHDALIYSYDITY